MEQGARSSERGVPEWWSTGVEGHWSTGVLEYGGEEHRSITPTLYHSLRPGF
jgi:hypothetical protein